jgi:hypothetical protein
MTYRWPSSHQVYVRYNEVYQDYDQPDDFAPSNDFRVRTANLGFSLTLSPQTLFQASGGYYYQSFQTGNDRNNDGFPYNAILDTRTEKMQLHLEGSGGFLLDFFSSQNLGPTKFHQALAWANYQLTEKLDISASASYRWEDYLGIDRRDEIWRTYAGLAYTVRDQLILSLNGAHLERTSTDSRQEFTDNRVTLKITLEYPLKLK